MDKTSHRLSDKSDKGEKALPLSPLLKENGESEQAQRTEQAEMSVIYGLLKVYFTFGFIGIPDKRGKRNKGGDEHLGLVGQKE